MALCGQTRLSDFTEYRTKEDMQLTELGTIKVREKGPRRKSGEPIGECESMGREDLFEKRRVELRHDGVPSRLTGGEGWTARK